jgi:hypothetical protein
MAILLVCTIWLVITTTPFVWLWLMHITGGSNIILTLCGFFYCCLWVAVPLYGLYRQWHEKEAKRNPVVLLLYAASLAARFVWLWKLYWMEGSSTVMTLIGFFFCCCRAYKPVTNMLRNVLLPAAAAGGQTLAG